MLDDMMVTYAPSAYVRAVCIARAGARERVGRLVVVGNPLPHRMPLPGSEFEAASIALTLPASEVTSLIGTDATKESVLAALPGATHVHLSCHGATAADPRELDAALSLAHERPVSGAEVLGLDLSAARLIVASACETGLPHGG